MPTDDGVGILGRYCVLLCWIDSTPGTEHGNANNGLGKPFTASAFLISVRNYRFLVTAGHVLRDIDVARAKAQKLTDFKLDDTLGSDAIFKDHSVPFVGFDECRKWYFDQDGADFGVIYLSPFICRQLQTRPVAENLWKVIPEDFQEYYLLGAPDKQQRIDTINGLHHQHVLALFPVQMECNPPEEFLTRCRRIYYRIPQILVSDDGVRLDDIDGMSGCPLIGVNKDKEGVAGYWFLGIQSAWYPKSRLATATPLKDIGEWLERGIMGLERERHKLGEPVARKRGE
jgi:hypothetical protein